MPDMLVAGGEEGLRGWKWAKWKFFTGNFAGGVPNGVRNSPDTLYHNGVTFAPVRSKQGTFPLLSET